MRSKSRRQGAAPEEPKLPFGAITFPQVDASERSKTPMRILLFSLPLVIVTVLLGLWLTSLFLWTMSARSQVDEGHFASAQVQYERQNRLTNVFPEPWLARYNLGTAMVLDGDLEGGIEYLELALEGVPRATRNDAGTIQPFSYECMVRMNLGAGIEMLGDIESRADKTEKANEYYTQALQLVTVCEVPNPSASDEGEGEGDGGFGESPEEQNEAAAQPFEQDGNEAGDRLREKLSGGQGSGDDSQDGEGEGENQQDSDSEGGQDEDQSPDQPGSDPYGNETPEERERRERLEERNREQAERQREREEYGHRNPGTGGW